MNKRLTASVVGGGTGGRLSMKGLLLSDFFELVAVADLNPQVCRDVEATYSGVRTFPSHEAMFAACPTDVVCVSTFPPSHEAVTLDALQMPLKGILVEKPLGHTAASGRQILKAVKQKGIPMVVPHGLLVRKTPVEILNRVRQGEIGELKLVEIQNRKWDIINAGIHWLNYFVTLTGYEDMDWVMAIAESSTRTYRDGMQVETTAITYGQTSSGVRVVMHTGDETMVNREGKDTLFRLVGTAGLIEFWGWEPAYWIMNRNVPQGQLIAPGDFPQTPHQLHLENLARMIDAGVSDYTLPASSLTALEIVEGAYLSSRHRCKVTFPFDAFTPPAPTDWNPGMPYDGSGGGRDGRKLGT